MGLKKFLCRIVGYTLELQDVPPIGAKSGAVVQSKQALQTAEPPKLVQEVSGQVETMWRSPSDKTVEPTPKEELKVEEVPKVTIETKPAEVVQQPVAEPVKAAGSRPRGRPRTKSERVLTRLKINGTNSVNSAGTSPKPRRTGKMASKGEMTVVPTETELGVKEKEKMAAPVLRGAYRD